jgi:type VI protein secretion system component Hcp
MKSDPPLRRPIMPMAKPSCWLTFLLLVLAALVMTPSLSSALEVQACIARSTDPTLDITSDPAACAPANRVEAISASIAVLGDLGSGPERQPLLLTKKIDQTSALLFLNSVKGQHFKNVLVVFFDGTAARRGNRVLSMLLSNAFIKRFAQGAQDQKISSVPVETVEFEYFKLQIRDDVSGSSGCWDFTTDLPC